MNEKLANSSGRSKLQLMLVGSRALSASRPTLISLLITGGAELGGGVEHPISFCNVLFVGNFCAALVVGFWFGFDSIVQDIKETKPKVIGGLLINGVLATLLSALIFLGLRETSVTNAVLLGRLGPVLFAIAGAIVLGKKIQRLEWLGFSLIGGGVIAIALATNGLDINRGDLLILISTLVFAISALINHVMVARSASLRLVVFSRNFISSIIFFIIAIALFGPSHFSDAVSGSLWILMAVYALVVIVCAQFLWYASTNNLDSRTIGRLTVLSPIFGVSYAFLLNGERPSLIQTTTLIVVIVGVIIAGLGKHKSSNSKQEMMSQESEDVASVP